MVWHIVLHFTTVKSSAHAIETLLWILILSQACNTCNRPLAAPRKPCSPQGEGTFCSALSCQTVTFSAFDILKAVWLRALSLGGHNPTTVSQGASADTGQPSSGLTSSNHIKHAAMQLCVSVMVFYSSLWETGFPKPNPMCASVHTFI